MEVLLEKGMLHHAEDGLKVACHLCAKEFAHLGNHVRRTHHLSAEEYTDLCWLAKTTGLISKQLAERRALDMQRNPEMMAREAGTMFLRSMTSAQRSRYMKARKVRLETLRQRPLVAARGMTTREIKKTIAAHERERRCLRVCKMCAGAFHVDKPSRRRLFCSVRCMGEWQRTQPRAAGLVVGTELKVLQRANRLNVPCRGCGYPLVDKLQEVEPTRSSYISLQVCSKACRDEVYPVVYARKENGQYDGMRKLYEASHN